MGYIYILKSPSGKIYIGQTIHSIEERFRQHQLKNSHCRSISSAIQKYGWENFEKDWYDCLDEDLNKHEKWMVKLMGTISPDGYNLMEGGGSGGKRSEEAKQNMRKPRSKEAKRNMRKSDETRQKMREAKKMSKAYLGTTRTKETKQKISESTKGENNHKSKRVYQYDLDGNLLGSFGSTEEAERYLIKGGSKISECARGNPRYKTAGVSNGLIIKYNKMFVL
jgi:group I intron endonuclease